MNPISIIIGQLVRAGLNIVGAYLLTVGVSQAQADSFVSAAGAVVVSIVLFLIAHGWSYLSKKNALESYPN